MARHKRTNSSPIYEHPPSYYQHDVLAQDRSLATTQNETLPKVTVDTKNSPCRLGSICISSAFSGAFIILLCIFIISALFSHSMRATCTVKWRFGEPCIYVMQRLKCQILKWSTCRDCGPRGSKCLYSLEDTSDNGTIRAAHLTSNLKLVERIEITFEEAPNNTCVATGKSESDQWFVMFDYGTNYCNLHNLATGAGFEMDRGFLELTNNAICTQLDTAVCA